MDSGPAPAPAAPHKLISGNTSLKLQVKPVPTCEVQHDRKTESKWLQWSELEAESNEKAGRSLSERTF